MTVRVAMWSGPRNISTAMMRSWENRPDAVVVDEASMLDLALARRLLEAPPIALAMTKRLLNNSLEVTMEEALDDEGMAQTVNFGTQDTMEAMTAFVEKRSPNFRGR